MLSQVNLKLSDIKRWGKAGRKERLDWQPEAKTEEERVSVILLEDHAENDHNCLGFLISFLSYSQGTQY